MLEARGDVDALAVPIRPLNDHLAQINADAQVDPLALGEAGVSLRHAALDVDGALDCVDHARELGEKPVAHQLED